MPRRLPEEASLRRSTVAQELLVLQAQAGSAKAFEALVRVLHPGLVRHAWRLTGNEALAADIVQDAWLRAARGLSRLREAAAFRRWVFTIVTRAATDALRRRPPERATAPETLDRLEPTDGEDAARAEAVALLRRALLQLDEEERALVSLHHLEGFDLQDLAAMYAVPLGTIKSRLHRVRGRLRELLERMNP